MLTAAVWDLSGKMWLKPSRGILVVAGLHEAAAVLQNVTIKKEEDRLAEYSTAANCSSEHAELDGAFFRAWDYRKWEVWASDADITVCSSLTVLAYSVHAVLCLSWTVVG